MHSLGLRPQRLRRNVVALLHEALIPLPGGLRRRMPQTQEGLPLVAQQEVDGGAPRHRGTQRPWHRHQAEPAGNPPREVHQQRHQQHPPVPDAAVEALVVRQCSVEGVPHVIDREGGNLDDPVDQEAHRVHQVRLELRVRRQPFIRGHGGLGGIIAPGQEGDVYQELAQQAGKHVHAPDVGVRPLRAELVQRLAVAEHEEHGCRQNAHRRSLEVTELDAFEVHDGKRVGGGQAQQPQDLEHLHRRHQGAPPLLDDVTHRADGGVLGCEGCRH
mmetsp:Transcript_14275/g.43114  ORF Transcript_14275/g.43114 Transcript_14275/m.43114 type:complete len:272 (+) Transcript_14275:343-1158(+)